MQYALFLNYLEAGDAGLTETDIDTGKAAFDQYVKALDTAGVFVSTQILEPVSASTTVSQRTGTLEIQDGPFADTRERVGGVFVIDVPDLDAAIGWAAKAPAAQWGSVEVRPTAISWSHDLGWYQP